MPYTLLPIMADDQDFSFKCWPEQAVTENTYPSEAFYSTRHHHDQHLFDTSLHHVTHTPHYQQDKLGMSAPTFSLEATNAVFFQMANATGAGMPPLSVPYHPRQDSPTSTHSGSHSKHHSTARSTDGDEVEAGSDGAQAAIKRQRNTMAARKYRQKRLDRIAELEHALNDITGERDELRLQLARREAEVEALREVLGKK